MAENPKFNNSDMFTGIDSNDYSEVKPDNNSEVLATQGNVINSIKVFWNKLRRKLVYAITRDDISEAVGGNYQPIFVNSDGIVQACEINTLTREVKGSNIDLINSDEIVSPYPGQIVCITVTKTNNTNNNNNTLTINNSSVYYPTNVQVKVSDVLNGTYLFTYIKGSSNTDKWILNNKINEAKSSGKTSENNNGNNNGYSGLMTADDKAKLNTIAWNANNFTYTLPTASTSNIGGVKSKTTGTMDGRYYDVQVNNDGTMKVNVPWQDTHNAALLRVGGNNNNNEATTNGNTYLKIVDGSNTSKIKISGSDGTSVSSDNSGNITIQSSRVMTYNKLGINNNDDSIGYVITGPGSSNATTLYYLAGNGTWQRGILVPIPTEEGKTLKSNNNGTVYWG